MYPINATASEHVFKGLKEIPIPNVLDAQVTAELPTSILQTIRTHGTVDMSSHFSIAATVTTLAGGTAGNLEGRGVNARFNAPYNICVNPDDNCLYVCDRYNDAIRKITLQGDVSTLVAKKGLSSPTGIAMNHVEKSFFVVNYKGNTISKISVAGTITAFAGSGQIGTADGVGQNATFNHPINITIDLSTGNLYVCEPVPT